MPGTVYNNFLEAKKVAMRTGGTIKRNPNGPGWVLFNIKNPSKFTPKPTKLKSHKTSSASPKITSSKRPYSKSTTKSTLSKEDTDLINKELEKGKKIQKTTKPDSKNIIPEECRRKVDDGIGGSREDWKKNRGGYYGDMK